MVPNLFLFSFVTPKKNENLLSADISQLLLCRQDTSTIHSDGFVLPSQRSQVAKLPVCIPAQSIQLYVGVGLQYEFSGRFTLVHRGVWRRNPDEQVQIVRKLLKNECRQSHSIVSRLISIICAKSLLIRRPLSQAFLESVQKAIFWRSETLVHIHGIILDVNLSVIMEYLPLGPLDEYLQENELPVIDLVEAATNLAKALFYLVDRQFLFFLSPFYCFHFFLFVFRKRKVSCTATSAVGICSWRRTRPTRSE